VLEAHPPLPPDQMVASCRGFDVGLSLEQPEEQHRALCLTNKALTYPLAGLAVALTDTPGQRDLGRDLGDGALVAPPGDVAALAAGLRLWAAEPARLAHAKAAAREAAERRWHWEHPRERGALLDAVARAVGERELASPSPASP
jgi:glycosyltransferase involved in cell wall biosynthesis